MSLTKYASLESAKVLELKSSPERVKTASLGKMGEFNDYHTDDGYLYARIRAISSRVNKNHDGWPTSELAGGSEAWDKISSKRESSESGLTIEASKDDEYGYSTFLGKPVFVDHHNSNPDRARGAIVDSKFNVLDQKTSANDDYWTSSDADPEHLPATEVELLLEIDAKSFPKLAKAIVSGDLDGFSMGCDVDYSKCSHCGHEAATPDEYCSHIQMKGADHDYKTADGHRTSKKSYENCYGIKFFEISAVFDPADETALAKEIRHEGSAKESANPFHDELPSIPIRDLRHLMGDKDKAALDKGDAESVQRGYGPGQAVNNPHGEKPALVPPHLVSPGDPNPLPAPVRDTTLEMAAPVIGAPTYENRPPGQWGATGDDGNPQYLSLADRFLDEEVKKRNPPFPKGIITPNTPRYQGSFLTSKTAFEFGPTPEQDPNASTGPDRSEIMACPRCNGAVRMHSPACPHCGLTDREASEFQGAPFLTSKTAYTDPQNAFKDIEYVPTPEEYEALKAQEKTPRPTYDSIEQAERLNQNRVIKSQDPESGNIRYFDGTPHIRDPKGYKWVPVPKGHWSELAQDPDTRGRIQPKFVGKGSYLASKVAEAPEPQGFHTKAPENVDTLREEKICPLCGSDMEGEKCDVCGYDEPPAQLQNPDLTKAQDADLTQQDQDEVQIPPGEEVPPPADGAGESYLNAKNPPTTASVISDMRWTPKLTASGPKGDEPEETVTSDQDTPVTSAFRTAKEMIQAAKRNQKENTMSDHNKVAADPADPSGKAKKQVDVTGTGGVDDASAEAASKADFQVDPSGKGGISGDNKSTSAPDSKESLPSGEQDNAGFQDGGNTEKIPTKTFPNTNEPDSAVTDKAFPVNAAKHGVDPADPSGKAQNRIDVEQPPHDKVGPDTQTWSGTDGNGVLKQQNPVTSVPTQSGGVKAGLVSLAALRLADTEVELGLINPDDKYNRLAELSDQSDEEIAAAQTALSKVKTAGLSRTAANGGVGGRLPSFKRIASEEAPEPQPVNDDLLDNAIFS